MFSQMWTGTNPGQHDGGPDLCVVERCWYNGVPVEKTVDGAVVSRSWVEGGGHDDV